VERRCGPPADDETVESWLRSAREGDREATDHLHQWAYLEAQEYFERKVQTEPMLEGEDVGELVGRFYADFESTWERARSITHYARRMLKNTTSRYIAHRRRRQSRFVFELPRDVAAEETATPWRAWSDEEWEKYRAVVRTYHAADEVTQMVVAGRLSDPPRSYTDLSDELGVRETALRMRLSRFYRAVRFNYQQSGQRGTPTPARAGMLPASGANTDRLVLPWMET
jgi:hypothetical protein